ncbi:methyltransferase domain-containing protein [Calothrix rhizosoleniae]|uniref:methyltransferase domain-containing protein n=1 Tax=Calothrix rhizosoleniae TaxID=888997 RepID=UPI000B49C22D|nr:methyltransferase domain-containing protein [Calothrix rhizosoleniae]
MAVAENTIWERFLFPVLGLLIDQEGLRHYGESVDWDKESDRFRRDDVVIPAYYSSQDFHGISGGYLNYNAAITYDPITQYVTPPNETWVRQELIDAIQVKPRRILDLGCGTASTTLMLKQAFPQAEVIGLDLSPYMLVRAAHKAESAGLGIKFIHGQAEATGLSANNFDLVTASLLFHEIPVSISQTILQESLRLLRVGGQLLVLDGNQRALRQLEFLNDIFVEPYIREYGAGSVDTEMGVAGFRAVHTKDVWWVHQLTSGIKAISGLDVTNHSNIRQYEPTAQEDLQIFPSPAFDSKA